MPRDVRRISIGLPIFMRRNARWLLRPTRAAAVSAPDSRTIIAALAVKSLPGRAKLSRLSPPL
jgi:hypothetical protein